LDASGEEQGVAHVHGLGINPADESLYVATHYGMFRIADGRAAERVGPSLQDTMGFTVVGPNSFLGSGHPDVAAMRAGQPGLLGLIESSDGGQSWTSRSLSGEVDFHVLAYAHDRVYGWDSTSGQLMISTDRETWEVRSKIQLHGFAVDPVDPARLVTATPGGVRISNDEGRTWSDPLGPTLATIAWAPNGTLWGVDLVGAVVRSDDRGQQWQATGANLPGEAQALTAAGDAVWAAAGGQDEPTRIYSSVDGLSWDLRYRDA
jgi:hypothetical protein